ncbi:MAG TPA: restriction endonuclease [Firmicutes bacterium]|jgi:hypothetical protein|nr:restriction endonuclease [Bacillota bacterium]
MLLEELFWVKNGIASCNVKISDEKNQEYCLAYIRPSQKWNNLVAGYLNKKEVDAKYIFPSDTLFISTDGEGSHSFAYVSPIEFVPNSNVSVLIPKKEMKLNEKIYYAMCITSNRYRFSYGRKPKGDRLKKINLPVSFPSFVYSIDIPNYSNLNFSVSSTNNRLSNDNLVRIDNLFDVQYGTSLALNSLEICNKYDENCVNFVSRTSQNNGVSAIVKLIDDIPPFSEGIITVAVSGNSVLEASVQDKPFYTGFHVMVLTPKRTMSFIEKFFYCWCIRQNRFRYSFGRQANRTLKELKIPSQIPIWIDKSKIDKYLKIIK